MKKSKSTAMADFWPKLPQELFDKVLLHLPARSVGRFRCVSKPWRAHLSSQKFFKSHFKLHLPKTAPNVIIPANRGLLTFPADVGSGRCRSRKVTCPLLRRGMQVSVKASCHGFVLVDFRASDSRHVLNPVTLESFKLPEYSLPRLLCKNAMYAMGYDRCSNDYKVVQIVYDGDSVAQDGFDERVYVAVYGFKKKCWTEVMDSPCYHGDPMIANHPGIYMNGYLHWVAQDKLDGDHVIAAFNLEREEFEVFPLPKDFFPDGVLQMVVLRECIAILCNRLSPGKGIEIWMMKEYGVQESWEKVEIDYECRDSRRISATLCFSEEDEVVLVEGVGLCRSRLAAYSLINGTWRDIVVDDLPDDINDQVLFTECLLSPNDASIEG